MINPVIFILYFYRFLLRSEDVDINLQVSSRDRLEIIQDIQQYFNTIANVCDEDLQSVQDVHVSPSIQLPSDPKDISSTSSRKRKSDTQIEEPLYKKFKEKLIKKYIRKKFNVKLIKKYNDEIYKSVCNSDEEFEKLMEANKKTILDSIIQITKILEKISKDDS